MSICFQKMSPAYVKKNHPSYYGEDITCFLILKEAAPTGGAPQGGTRAGFYGMIDRGIDPLTNGRQAEAFLTIFPAFRYRVLGKGFFLGLFDHAFKSGFEKVYTWTRLISWQKLLDRFEPLGIHRLETLPSWDNDPTKVWFMKQKKKEA